MTDVFIGLFAICYLGALIYFLQRARLYGHSAFGIVIAFLFSPYAVVMGSYWVAKDLLLMTRGKCFAVCVQNTPRLTSKNITFYSLRHSSIMFRLMYGDDIDTLYLAKNARTSQLMIERFYAQYLTGDHV